MIPLSRCCTKFFIAFLVASLTFSCTAGQEKGLALPSSDYSVPFRWLGDSVNGAWERYNALLVPVRLPGCPKLLYMQFDLGAPNSLFYTGPLDAVRSRYPSIIPDADTSGRLHNFTFSISRQQIMAAEILVKLSGDPAPRQGKGSITALGTLDVDWIAGKTLVVDYPGRRISILDSIPAALKRQAAFSGFILARGSILLPATLLGKKAYIYFDTGSSAYELLTSQEACKTLALPGGQVVSYPVKSWGKTLAANTMATGDSIVFASQKFPIGHATYIEGASDSQVQQMLKLGIGGMTGNRLFLHSVLVLDTQHKKFGVIVLPLMP